MTLLYICLIFVSYMIGVWTSPLFKKKEKKEEVNLRKGLLYKSFSVTNILQKKETLDAEFEILEVERTSEKSKIKVIDCHPSKSEYNSGSNKQELINMIDGSWILSKDIEWIEKPIEDTREEKLNQILN